MKKATTTTPIPELSTPLGTEEPAPDELNGRNIRGEVAGCPTGLANLDRPKPTQRPRPTPATDQDDRADG
jgi:hypothetical protein